MASLEGTFNTASDLILSSSEVPERSRQMAPVTKTARVIATFKHAVFHPFANMG